MPSPISRRPAGLLDLLLAQQQGKNPADLLESVQPILDMVPFYNTDRLTDSNQAFGATAVGGGTNIEVPAGEYWRMISAGIFVTFATVNQEIKVSLALSQIGSTTQYITEFDGLRSAVRANDQEIGGYDFPSNLIVPSGARFRFECDSINLDGQPSIVVSGTLLYVRMAT